MKQFRLLPILGLAITLLASSCSKKEYALFSYSGGGATAGLKVQQTQQPAAQAPVAFTPTVKSFDAAQESNDCSITGCTTWPCTPKATEATTTALAANVDVAKAVAEVKQMNMVQKIKLAKEVRKAVKEIKEGKEATAAKGGKSQLIALLLVLFVGGLGIHRFYLGYTWQGVVQLLTVGLCGIWTLIDLIRIIIGDLGPKGGSYDTTL